MPVQPRTLIIYNPTAGHAHRAWPAVCAALQEAGCRYEVHATRYAGDATERVRVALREGYQNIVAAGGDGTLGEVATGFFHLPADGGRPVPLNTEAALAPLPLGTGNDFTRALAGRPEPLEKWLAALTTHLRTPRTRTVDTLYGITQEQQFVALNLVSLGISVEAINRVRGQAAWLQKLPGEARFVWAALGALRVWRERPVRVSLDEEEPRSFATNLLAFANSRFAGGGMIFAPNAQLDDGWLDAVLSTRLSRAGIVRELPRIRYGGHVANPKVTIRQARRVRVATAPGAEFMVEADSNLRGHTPLDLRVMPGALQVVCC
jgi:YegS/Rv2252/BmrU family lipid kinase